MITVNACMVITVALHWIPLLRIRLIARQQLELCCLGLAAQQTGYLGTRTQAAQGFCKALLDWG